jgi:hypothetical protein
MLLIGRFGCYENHENIFGLTPFRVFFWQKQLIEIEFILSINW